MSREEFRVFVRRPVPPSFFEKYCLSCSHLVEVVRSETVVMVVCGYRPWGELMGELGRLKHDVRHAKARLRDLRYRRKKLARRLNSSQSSEMRQRLGKRLWKLDYEIGRLERRLGDLEREMEELKSEADADYKCPFSPSLRKGS